MERGRRGHKSMSGKGTHTWHMRGGQACAPADRTRVRRTLSTLCELRETEARSAACLAKADRALDLTPARARAAVLRRRCETLARRLKTLEAPRCRRNVRDAIEAGFDAGRLASRNTRRADADITTDEVRGVAVLAPGWRVAASRIDDLPAIERVLAYLERRPTWRRIRLTTSPHPAVPRFVATGEAYARLQNLPVWQSSRLTLVACALARRAQAKTPVGARELSSWVRTLGVHDAYVPALRALRSELGR